MTGRPWICTWRCEVATLEVGYLQASKNKAPGFPKVWTRTPHQQGLQPRFLRGLLCLALPLQRQCYHQGSSLLLFLDSKIIRKPVCIITYSFDGIWKKNIAYLAITWTTVISPFLYEALGHLTKVNIKWTRIRAISAICANHLPIIREKWFLFYLVAWT